MSGLLWTVLVICCLVLFVSLRGRLFTDPARNHRVSVAVGAMGVLAVLGLVGIQVQHSAEASRKAAQQAAQARAAHEKRLAWQKAHPKEWAAQKAAARAALYKAAAERQTQRLAQQKRDEAQSEYATEHTPCKEFGRGLESLNVGSVLASYNCSEIGGGVLIHITVRDSAWGIADYDERLRLAKGLWATCVKYAHPDQADSCHVKLVGEAGEDLGGSNDFAGSMIDVSKD